MKDVSTSVCWDPQLFRCQKFSFLSKWKRVTLVWGIRGSLKEPAAGDEASSLTCVTNVPLSIACMYVCMFGSICPFFYFFILSVSAIWVLTVICPLPLVFLYFKRIKSPFPSVPAPVSLHWESGPLYQSSPEAKVWDIPVFALIDYGLSSFIGALLSCKITLGSFFPLREPIYWWHLFRFDLLWVCLPETNSVISPCRVIQLL